MRKISLLLCLALCLASFAILFSGCHKPLEREAYTLPDEFDTSRTFEIDFWAKNDSNTVQVNAYKKAIESFEAIYPNIKVNLKHYTDYGRIYQDVITNIANDTTPNVCITYPDHVATYKEGNNVVVPIGDFFEDPKYGLGGSEVKFDAPTKSEMIQKFLNECLIDGKYYAVPFIRSTEACYVNKTYVEKLGYTLPEKLTWDFVWEVSEAAMKKDDDGNFIVNGQKTMIPFIYKSTDNMMIQMLAQKGAGYSDNDGNVLIFNDDTSEIMKTVAEHAKTRAFSTFSISSYPANYLNAGQCIFAIDSTAGAMWMGPKAPNSDIHGSSVIDYEIEVMTIPQYDTETPKMISQGPSLCVFNKEDPQVVLASWLFVQYLLTNDVQYSYATTEGYVPVTIKAQESETYREYLSYSDSQRVYEGEDPSHVYDVKLIATKLLIDNTDNTFITPVFSGSMSLRNAAGFLIEESAKTVRRGGAVDDAKVDELFEKATINYHLDDISPAGEGVNSSELNHTTESERQSMPVSSVILLIVLGGCWLFFGIFAIFQRKKRKKPSNY